MDLNCIDELKNKAGLEGFHDKLNVVGEEVENVQEDASLCWGDYIVESAMHQENGYSV